MDLVEGLYKLSWDTLLHIAEGKKVEDTGSLNLSPVTLNNILGSCKSPFVDIM